MNKVASETFSGWKGGLSVYRFGFNGKEQDPNIKGQGNSYDFGARIYDPRIGRWLSVDPLQAKYSGISPYTFALNTPIQAYDPDGRDVFFISGGGIKTDTEASEVKSASTNEQLNAFTKLMGSKFHWIKSAAPDYKILASLRGSRWSVLSGHKPLKKPMSKSSVAGAVNEIKTAYHKSIEDGDAMEVNIIGFSYGSVVGAQAALELVRQGVPVHSITLAKSMIDKNSVLYKKLKKKKINILVSDNEVTNRKGKPIIDVVTNASGTNGWQARRGWWKARRTIGRGHRQGAQDRSHPYRIMRDLFFENEEFTVEGGRYNEKAKEIVGNNSTVYKHPKQKEDNK